MIDYTKLRIDDLKQMIVDGGFYTREQLDNMEVKGKSQWVDLHKTLTASEVEPEDNKAFVFEDMETVEHMTKPDPNPNPMPAAPSISDPEWQDYVLSQFAPNEMIKDRKTGKEYPTVNGLRRVVELLLGEIVQAGPSDLRTTMDPDIPGKAVVVYEIGIQWKLDAGPYIDLAEDKPHLPVKWFRGVASSWHGNTDDMFAVFPESIAETRAEGRALRRALRLGVVCADELTSKDTAEIVRQKTEKSTDGSWEEGSLISDAQVNSIKIMCERLGIDVNKFINSGSKKYGDILEISRQTAANMIKRLNEYQSNSSSVEIPVDLLLEK